MLPNRKPSKMAGLSPEAHVHRIHKEVFGLIIEASLFSLPR